MLVDALVATHHVQMCLRRILDEAAKKVLEGGLPFSDRSVHFLLGSGQRSFLLRIRTILCDVEWFHAIALTVVEPDSIGIWARALVLVFGPWFRPLLTGRVNAFALVTEDAFANQVVVASFLGLEPSLPGG